jgi:hypothetical protein
MTLTLYVGSTGGAGRLDVTVPGAGVLPVDLPSCPGTCGAMVTVSMRNVSANLPDTGDLTIDVYAGSGSSKVGVAAAALF